MTSGSVNEGARWQTIGQKKDKRMSRKKKWMRKKREKNLSCRFVTIGLASKVELSPQKKVLTSQCFSIAHPHDLLVKLIVLIP